MKDTVLYTQLLGIAPPWQVSGVELNVKAKEVRVRVEWDPSIGGLVCPICQKPCPGYDHREERTWRHLDSCGFETWLVARTPRIECEEQGVQSVELPWTRPNSRFTLAFESFVLRVLEATETQSEVAELLGLSSEQVHDLMVKAVERGLSRRDREESIPHITLDETSQGPRHDYITVVTDGERVLEVSESRDQKAAENSLKSALSEPQRDRVETATMDLLAAYANAAKAVLPQADVTLDHFHLSSDLQDALDQTRRAEAKKGPEEKQALKGTRYLWLKDPKDLSEEDLAQLEEWMDKDLETWKVWSLKEEFKGFFQQETEELGEAFFQSGYQRAKALGNEVLTKVAESFHSHLSGMLAFIRHHVTNAQAEELNGEIQTLKANARGFRAFEHFRIAILFHLGHLDLYPHSSR